MANSLQPKPSDATAATFVQPDWNSKYGVGKAVGSPTNFSFATIYDTMITGEQARHDA